MYCIISSSPISSSSSIELGAGDGVDNDWRLLDGVPMVCWMLGVDEELFDDRAVGSETLGLSSLRPFEGERAENRWCECDDACGCSCAAELVDATELVEDLRRPNESDSRFLRGIVLPFAVAFVADVCRGTREEEV